MRWSKWTSLKLMFVWEVTRPGIVKEKQTPGSVLGMKLKRWGHRSRIKVADITFGDLYSPFLRYQHVTLLLNVSATFHNQPVKSVTGLGELTTEGKKRLAKTHARLKSYMCLKLLTFTIDFSWSPFKNFTPTMLKIVSVSDLVTTYLKLNFDMCILTHFQASECSWRDVVAGLQVASIFMGEKGEKQSPPNLSLPSVDIAF